MLQSQITGASNQQYAHIGDTIVTIIKEAIPNTPIEKSKAINAVTVCT